MNKNDYIEIQIDDIGTDGQGIGKFEGMAVFIAGALPTEIVRAKLILLKKNYAVGKLEEILTPSPARVKPPCPVFSRCGGCTLQHLAYAGQLEYKQNYIQNCLRRIGGLDIPVLFPMPSPHEYRYRNKAAFPVRFQNNKPEVGLFAAHSHHLVDVADCLLQRSEIAVIVSQLRVWLVKYAISIYNEETGTGLLRHIILRSNNSGEFMLIFVINGNTLPYQKQLMTLTKLLLPQVKTIILNHNREKTNVILGAKSTVLSGKGYLFDTINGLEFKVGPSSFLQVNPYQTEVLYKNLFRLLDIRSTDTVFDLYCGVGTLTLHAAKGAKQAFGIEISEEAVQNAVFNANLNDIDNVVFYAGDAYRTSSQVIAEHGTPDIVIVDPPRKGLSAEMLNLIIDSSPRAIGYVSCDPATLARDLALFAQKGYAADSVQPVDLFPQTTHVECLTVMSKVNG